MKKWKDLSTKEKIKKVAKYTTNFLGMIMFILAGLNKIDGIEISIMVYEIIGVIQGAIGIYLVGGKLWNTEDDYGESDDK